MAKIMAARYALIVSTVALAASLGSLYIAKLSYDLAASRDERDLSEKTPAIDIQLRPAGVSTASMVVSITNRSDANITPLAIRALHSFDLGTLYIESATQNIQLMQSTLSLSRMGTIKPKETATMKATLAAITDGKTESFTPGAEVQFSVDIRLADGKDTVRTFDVMRRVKLP